LHRILQVAEKFIHLFSAPALASSKASPRIQHAMRRLLFIRPFVAILKQLSFVLSDLRDQAIRAAVNSKARSAAWAFQHELGQPIIVSREPLKALSDQLISSGVSRRPIQAFQVALTWASCHWASHLQLYSFLVQDGDQNVSPLSLHRLETLLCMAEVSLKMDSLLVNAVSFAENSRQKEGAAVKNAQEQTEKARSLLATARKKVHDCSAPYLSAWLDLDKLFDPEVELLLSPHSFPADENLTPELELMIQDFCTSLSELHDHHTAGNLESSEAYDKRKMELEANLRTAHSKLAPVIREAEDSFKACVRGRPPDRCSQSSSQLFAIHQRLEHLMTESDYLFLESHHVSQLTATCSYLCNLLQAIPRPASRDTAVIVECLLQGNIVNEPRIQPILRSNPELFLFCVGFYFFCDKLAGKSLPLRFVSCYDAAETQDFESSAQMEVVVFLDHSGAFSTFVFDPISDDHSLVAYLLCSSASASTWIEKWKQSLPPTISAICREMELPPLSYASELQPSPSDTQALVALNALASLSVDDTKKRGLDHSDIRALLEACRMLGSELAEVKEEVCQVSSILSGVRTLNQILSSFASESTLNSQASTRLKDLMPVFASARRLTEEFNKGVRLLVPSNLMAKCRLIYQLDHLKRSRSWMVIDVVLKNLKEESSEMKQYQQCLRVVDACLRLVNFFSQYSQKMLQVDLSRLYLASDDAASFCSQFVASIATSMELVSGHLVVQLPRDQSYFQQQQLLLNNALDELGVSPHFDHVYGLRQLLSSLTIPGSVVLPTHPFLAPERLHPSPPKTSPRVEVWRDRLVRARQELKSVSEEAHRISPIPRRIIREIRQAQSQISLAIERVDEFHEQHLRKLVSSPHTMRRMIMEYRTLLFQSDPIQSRIDAAFPKRDYKADKIKSRECMDLLKDIAGAETLVDLLASFEGSSNSSQASADISKLLQTSLQFQCWLDLAHELQSLAQLPDVIIDEKQLEKLTDLCAVVHSDALVRALEDVRFSKQAWTRSVAERLFDKVLEEFQVSRRDILLDPRISKYTGAYSTLCAAYQPWETRQANSAPSVQTMLSLLHQAHEVSTSIRNELQSYDQRSSAAVEPLAFCLMDLALLCPINPSLLKSLFSASSEIESRLINAQDLSQLRFVVPEKQEMVEPGGQRFFPHEAQEDFVNLVNLSAVNFVDALSGCRCSHLFASMRDCLPAQMYLALAIANLSMVTLSSLHIDTIHSDGNVSKREEELTQERVALLKSLRSVEERLGRLENELVWEKQEEESHRWSHNPDKAKITEFKISVARLDTNVRKLESEHKSFKESLSKCEHQLRHECDNRFERQKQARMSLAQQLSRCSERLSAVFSSMLRVLSGSSTSSSPSMYESKRVNSSFDVGRRRLDEISQFVMVELSNPRTIISETQQLSDLLSQADSVVDQFREIISDVRDSELTKTTGLMLRLLLMSLDSFVRMHEQRPHFFSFVRQFSSQKSVSRDLRRLSDCLRDNIQDVLEETRKGDTASVVERSMKAVEIFSLLEYVSRSASSPQFQSSLAAYHSFVRKALSICENIIVIQRPVAASFDPVHQALQRYHHDDGKLDEIDLPQDEAGLMEQLNLVQLALPSLSAAIVRQAVYGSHGYSVSPFAILNDAQSMFQKMCPKFLLVSWSAECLVKTLALILKYLSDQKLPERSRFRTLLDPIIRACSDLAKLKIATNTHNLFGSIASGSLDSLVRQAFLLCCQSKTEDQEFWQLCQQSFDLASIFARQLFAIAIDSRYEHFMASLDQYPIARFAQTKPIVHDEGKNSLDRSKILLHDAAKLGDLGDMIGDSIGEDSVLLANLEEKQKLAELYLRSLADTNQLAKELYGQFACFLSFSDSWQKLEGLHNDVQSILLTPVDTKECHSPSLLQRLLGFEDDIAQMCSVNHSKDVVLSGQLLESISSLRASASEMMDLWKNEGELLLAKREEHRMGLFQKLKFLAQQKWDEWNKNACASRQNAISSEAKYQNDKLLIQTLMEKLMQACTDEKNKNLLKTIDKYRELADKCFKHGILVPRPEDCGFHLGSANITLELQTRNLDNDESKLVVSLNIGGGSLTVMESASAVAKMQDFARSLTFSRQRHLPEMNGVVAVAIDDFAKFEVTFQVESEGQVRLSSYAIPDLLAALPIIQLPIPKKNSPAESKAQDGASISDPLSLSSDQESFVQIKADFVGNSRWINLSKVSRPASVFPMREFIQPLLTQVGRLLDSLQQPSQPRFLPEPPSPESVAFETVSSKEHDHQSFFGSPFLRSLSVYTDAVSEYCGELGRLELQLKDCQEDFGSVCQIARSVLSLAPSLGKIREVLHDAADNVKMELARLDPYGDDPRSSASFICTNEMM